MQYLGYTYTKNISLLIWNSDLTGLHVSYLATLNASHLRRKILITLFFKWFFWPKQILQTHISKSLLRVKIRNLLRISFKKILESSKLRFL